MLTRDEMVEQRIKKIKYDYWLKRLIEIKEQKASLHSGYLAAVNQLEQERKNIADFKKVLAQPVSPEFLLNIQRQVDLELLQVQQQKEEKRKNRKLKKEQEKQESLEEKIKNLKPDSEGKVKLRGFVGKLRLEEAIWHLRNGHKSKQPQAYQEGYITPEQLAIQLKEEKAERDAQAKREGNQPNPFW